MCEACIARAAVASWRLVQERCSETGDSLAAVYVPVLTENEVELLLGVLDEAESRDSDIAKHPSMLALRVLLTESVEHG